MHSKNYFVSKDLKTLSQLKQSLSQLTYSNSRFQKPVHYYTESVTKGDLLRNAEQAREINKVQHYNEIIYWGA